MKKTVTIDGNPLIHINNEEWQSFSDVASKTELDEAISDVRNELSSEIDEVISIIHSEMANDKDSARKYTNMKFDVLENKLYKQVTILLVFNTFALLAILFILLWIYNMVVDIPFR